MQFYIFLNYSLIYEYSILLIVIESNGIFGSVRIDHLVIAEREVKQLIQSIVTQLIDTK
jgi:hypothetical protein